MDGNIAEIRMFAGNFAPRNWAFCQGQILSISSNTALFSLLGTTYGGNGTTTFALPDLRSRVPVGPAQGPGLSSYILGQTGGTENETLTTNQMPNHTHGFTVNNNTTGMATTGSGNFLNSKTESGESTAASGSPSAPVNLNVASVNTAGGSQPHNNLQPYLAMNYIICLFGIFPSRN
jgi:microcystin-dependent protein